MPHALIIGAGRIGRGFLGQLLHRAGYALTFVDGAPALVDALRRAGTYRVDIAGRPEAGERIPVAAAIAVADAADLRRAVLGADLMASAVGANNLAAVAAALAAPLAERLARRPLDWLICENAERPAAIIRAALVAAAPGSAALLRSHLGLVETQVLRSGMPADPAIAAGEPLALRMSDWWTLPADAEAFTGAPPAVPGLQPRRGFANETVRKLYTFNGLNGPISYLGWSLGHRLLHEAAGDPRLQDLLAAIRGESAHGLLGEFAFDPAEHAAFQAIAWAKYRDPALADAIERNARDSARKLGANERLVGPALLCLKHGREPRGYAAAIAAALRYDGSDDAGSRAVRDLVRDGGPALALARLAGLAADHPLSRLVLAAWGQPATAMAQP